MSPKGLALIASQGAMQAAQEEQQLKTLINCTNNNDQHGKIGDNSDTCMSKVTNNHLMNFRPEIVWYYKPCSLPVAGEVMDPSGEPTTVALLSHYISQQHSKYLPRCPQIVSPSMFPLKQLFYTADGGYYNHP